MTEPKFDKDSKFNTVFIATTLCLICSFLVSAAAVMLKPMQDKNVERDRKKNILEVVGFTKEEIGSGSQIEELFAKQFTTNIINLDSGKIVDENDAGFQAVMKAMNIATFEDALNLYDPFLASKKNNSDVRSDKLEKSEDVANIQYREKYSVVYFLTGGTDDVKKVVLPVRGYGLWSMMKGFLAVEPDFQNIAGLTFYEQKETPGLGGEVDNPKWKAIWTEGKKIYNEDGLVQIKVIKGSAPSDDPYAVDGLSGATITSQGVSKMLDYWMGPSGFKEFIKVQKTKGSAASTKKQGGLDG